LDKSPHSGKPKKRIPVLAGLKVWKLEEAKARFSEVVKMAREKAPQRVTVHGDDAVVVVSAREFAKLLPLSEQPNLHHLLSRSPLNKLDLAPLKGVRSPVRDVDL